MKVLTLVAAGLLLGATTMFARTVAAAVASPTATTQDTLRTHLLDKSGDASATRATTTTPLRPERYSGRSSAARDGRQVPPD